MRMGNFLSETALCTVVMAARSQPIGMNHLTVVPTNFDPDADEEIDRSDSASASNTRESKT